MSFVDQMTGAWIERQHSNAAQRASSDNLADWMAYARKLEAKIANQQQNIRTMNATIEDLRSSSEGWKETALDRLGDIVALRAELEAVKGAGA